MKNVTYYVDDLVKAAQALSEREVPCIASDDKVVVSGADAGYAESLWDEAGVDYYLKIKD